MSTISVCPCCGKKMPLGTTICECDEYSVQPLCNTEREEAAAERAERKQMFIAGTTRRVADHG